MAATALAPRIQFKDSRISAVLEYLQVHPLHDLPRFRMFAATFNISESYLRHKFKEMVGLSFREYVRRLRFQRAKALLESGCTTVKQARLEVGMLDHSSFAKAYKMYFGETPTSTKRRAGREKWKLILLPASVATRPPMGPD